MDFDQMYNARVVDKRRFTSRLDISRTQSFQADANSLLNSTADAPDEEMDKAVRETAECVESVTPGKVPLRPGMLFWIATHKGCYFWVRSAF